METAVLGERSVGIKKGNLPQVMAAGQMKNAGVKENADYSIRQDVHMSRSDTPEHIRKYRKSNVNEPGKIQKHWGMADDQPKMDQSHSFGKVAVDSEHVDQILKAQNLEGLADKFNDIKEGQYASNKREPLGKSFNRNYNWPDKISSSGHSFGVPTVGVDNAKEMLYPANGAQIAKDTVSASMYRKTHGNYQPGEQRKRDYDWKIQPESHVFGYQEKTVLNGAAMALQSEQPQTTIVLKTVEDHKAVSSDHLGRSKNLGQGQPQRDPNHVYGVKNVQAGDPWNAARCIHGEPTEAELHADKDLGRASKPGCRNVVRREEDRTRAFGLPTVRSDIPEKKVRSVADFQNYGDEPEAVDLLFPSNYSEIGIDETDFRSLRSREEIRGLFARIGFSYKIGKFNAMYNRAKELAGSQDDRVSVRHF